MKIQQTQKNVYIMQTNPGRLANQLWNYASVYAYCLERGYTCKNPSFFRYAHYFEGTKLESFGKVYAFIQSPKLFYIIYSLYAQIILFLYKHQSVEARDTEFLLPPSIFVEHKSKQLRSLEESKKDIYLNGWLFRNPKGLIDFRKQVSNFFKPKPEFCSRAEMIIQEARKEYSHCIGVHIRHGDYKIWENGKYYVTFDDAANILRKYTTARKFDLAQTCFIICSDESIDENIFEGLNIYKGPGTEIEDLYVLSLTDGIIGSHSTYGPWAAYVGNIPFTEFSHI